MKNLLLFRFFFNFSDIITFCNKHPKIDFVLSGSNLLENCPNNRKVIINALKTQKKPKFEAFFPKILQNFAIFFKNK